MGLCVSIAQRLLAWSVVEKLEYLLAADDWYAFRNEFDALDANKVRRMSLLQGVCSWRGRSLLFVCVLAGREARVPRVRERAAG